MVKRMELKDFEVSRYTKPISMFKLKDNDELLSVSIDEGNDVIVVTKDGYVLRYDRDEIPLVGLRTSGVKSIKLGDKDEVVASFTINESKEYISVFTDKNTAKRIKIDEINKTSRAKKGSLILKSPKSKKYNIFKCFGTGSKTIFGILDGLIGYMKASDINIMDISSVGSTFTKKNVDDVFVVSKLKDVKELINDNTLEQNEEIKAEKKESVIEEEPKKNKEQLTMSDFFEEFKL